MKVKEESENAGWKLSIQKSKIMATNPITMAHIREKVQIMTDFVFLGSKITVDIVWSHEIKSHLLLRWKANHLDNLLKSRDIILLTNVHIVKAMVFPIVIFRSESWTVKKAECQRTDVFELWCWRRLSRVPCTARRSNQSVLKEINPEILIKGLMLKLKLQHFGHLMWRAYTLEKILMLGNIEGRRRRGWQRLDC